MKICLVGHFGNNTNQYDGQTVKTRELYRSLVKKYSKDNIIIIDTYLWKKHFLKILRSCLAAAKRSDDIIIMPSHNGLRVFVPLFVRIRKKYSFKLHYIVIGGWLYEYMSSRRWLEKDLKKIDYIYVENKKMAKRMNDVMFDNVYYMPNFKDLETDDECAVGCQHDGFRCCIFSRIEEKKGILDAINVVERYNASSNDKIHLDIYGKVRSDFLNTFEEAVCDKKYIMYCGPVEPRDSVRYIKRYDLLLFPTKYKTEGVPGTIIDAFFAGTPVFASRWDNFGEIIDEDKTGFGYIFGNLDDFYEKLKTIVEKKDMLVKMRKKCIRKAYEYTPDVALGVLFTNLERHK